MGKISRRDLSSAEGHVSEEKTLKLTVLGLMLATLSSLQAATIGQLFLGGQAEVTLTTIDWTMPYIPGPAINGTGTTLVTGGNGIFGGVPFGSPLTIVDRDALAGQPAGVPINVPNWLSGPGLGTLVFDLTFILPGVYSSAQCGAAPADEQTCTPAAAAPFTSPYNLSNFNDGTGLSSNATFSVSGNVRNTAGNTTVGTFTGVFGAEFQNQSYQQVLSTVLAGGSVLPSYSATLTVSSEIPEPGSIGLFALGGGLLIAASRRIKRSV
jgi:hypothetical protein